MQIKKKCNKDEKREELGLTIRIEVDGCLGESLKGAAHWPSTLGEGAPEEGGANSPALWTLADMRSTNWLCSGAHHAHHQLLNSVSVQVGCMALELCCLPQLPQALQQRKTLNEKVEIDRNTLLRW